MRAASDRGTGRRGRKLDASPDCHFERYWRWLFAAHWNPLGGYDRCEWGECVRGGQKRLNGLALPREVSGKTLLLLTLESGATQWSWSSRPVGPLQINPPARAPVGLWTAAGSPERGRKGMSRSAAPTAGLLPGQGALSRQEGGGGVRVVPRPPRHKLPEGSWLRLGGPKLLHHRADCLTK